jgi:hypothetical protein
LTIVSPLGSAEASVRELHVSDAQLLADAAQSVGHVRGDLPLPASLDEAATLLAKFEALRAADLGNLFGVWGPGDTGLVGVASMRLTDPDAQVAEGAMWARPDRDSRYAMAHGLDLIVHEIHNSMTIFRVWVSMDALDPMAKHLLWATMFTKEGEVLDADGGRTIRYSSIARPTD